MFLIGQFKINRDNRSSIGKKMKTWHLDNNAFVKVLFYKDSRGLNWRLHTKMYIFTMDTFYIAIQH